jgi:hypothetical protein
MKEMESNQRGSITSVYDYTSAYGAIIPDPLQRFSHVKIEATSFTVSEPFAPLTIAPIVYDKASDNQKAILKSQFEVMPFSINTIRLERIFVDKVFASEYYYQRQAYFDVSKHIYDLAVMAGLDVIKRLLADPAELADMMAFIRREESARIGSNLTGKAISSFAVFNGVNETKALRDRYISMQDIYIYDDNDKMDFECVTALLAEIQAGLLNV